MKVPDVASDRMEASNVDPLVERIKDPSGLLPSMRHQIFEIHVEPAAATAAFQKPAIGDVKDLAFDPVPDKRHHALVFGPQGFLGAEPRVVDVFRGGAPGRAIEKLV